MNHTKPKAVSMPTARLQVGARFMAALAARLEDARGGGDGLACHNLAMVAVHAFLAGLIGPPVLYSLLAHLTTRCAPMP